MAEHHRRAHKIARQYKEPRVFCQSCQKEHSLSNKSRCRRRTIRQDLTLFRPGTVTVPHID
jgi:hypothetical protein